MYLSTITLKNFRKYAYNGIDITDTASAGEGGVPLSKDQMFDLDLYQTHIDEGKRVALANEIVKDTYLSYLVLAIKHAAGIEG